MSQRFMVFSSNYYSELVKSDDSHGHGCTGHIKKGSWCGKSIDVGGENLNKGSLIAFLKAYKGDTSLKKGWFLGLGRSSDKAVIAAYKKCFPTDIHDLEKDAKNGSCNAQFAIGNCYEKGDGVEKDLQTALEYYQRAADNGHVEAQYKMGQHFQQMGNNEKAAEYYHLSADQGNSLAQYALAKCYSTGSGIAKNSVQAAHYYQLASGQGHVKAHFFLGQCYEKGRGVARNFGEAFKYYKLAADDGDVHAQYALGECYEGGIGVRRDTQKAQELYTLAAEQGLFEAQEKLLEAL